MRSVKTFLKSYSKRSASAKVITTFLALILTLRNFFIQLQKLLKDKKLHYGSNLRTLIRKHLYGPLRKEIHIPIDQDIFTYISLVYRRHNFYTKHPSIKFEYEISKERMSFLDTKIYIKSH